MPRVVMPMGQTAQKTGNCKTAEPTRDAKSMLFAAAPPNLLLTIRVIGHVGQAAVGRDAFWAARFSLLLCSRACRLASSPCMNVATNRSKASIMLPTGQIQLQKKLPNNKTGKRNNKTAITARQVADSYLTSDLRLQAAHGTNKPRSGPNGAVRVSPNYTHRLPIRQRKQRLIKPTYRRVNIMVRRTRKINDRQNKQNKTYHFHKPSGVSYCLFTVVFLTQS